MLSSKTTSTKRAGSAAQANSDVLPSTRVLRQFRIVFNAVKTHFRQVEKAAGVGGAQVWALSVIRATPGIGVGDLARAMDVHQSTASNLVKSLLERKMVAVEKDERDRRVVTLHILKNGADVLRSAPAPFAGVLPDALEGLDPRTLARLEKDLGTLIAALKVDESEATTPLANL